MQHVSSNYSYHVKFLKPGPITSSLQVSATAISCHQHWCPRHRNVRSAGTSILLYSNGVLLGNVCGCLLTTVLRRKLPWPSDSCLLRDVLRGWSANRSVGEVGNDVGVTGQNWGWGQTSRRQFPGSDYPSALRMVAACSSEPLVHMY